MTKLKRTKRTIVHSQIAFIIATIRYDQERIYNTGKSIPILEIIDNIHTRRGIIKRLFETRHWIKVPPFAKMPTPETMICWECDQKFKRLHLCLVSHKKFCDSCWKKKEEREWKPKS